MKDCWAENPENRPDMTAIRNRLKTLKNGMKANIMDQMVEMLEKYSNNLEVRVRQIDVPWRWSMTGTYLCCP